MSRGACAVAAGAALVLLAGTGVVALQRADSSVAYDEQAAVEAFRSGNGSSPAAGLAEPSAGPSASPPPEPAGLASASPVQVPQQAPAGQPATRSGSSQPPPAADDRPSGEVLPGVYRYATEGHEQVDALGGRRHDYPASTTITYSRKDCGTEERWQPLEGRIGVSVYCPEAGASQLRATYQEREFFGRSQSESYRCDPGVLVRPRDPRPGQSWRGQCRSDDSTVSVSGRVVALEELRVEGRRVPVVRVSIRGTVTGSVRGRTDREVWLARSDGLLVQATADTDTVADTPAGAVRYRERYRLRLQSLTPSR
jgi:hypothetical protein